MLVTAKHVHVRLLLLGALLCYQARQTIALMAHLCSGRIQENLAPCELWSLTWVWWTTLNGKRAPAKGEFVAQVLGSCARKLGFHPLVTTWWASLVVIIERGGIAGPRGKGVMACGCSGTQWLITDANEMVNGEGIQARGAG